MTADPSAPVRVVLGPDRFDPSAIAALFSGWFAISTQSDRVGTRLEGPAIVQASTALGRSCPLVRGAIEVPASGDPIVLGPEHPTTGGYPVIGVVAGADQGRFFARPLGALVRFCQA
jgi:allophanate hydrolase subunit 2